MSFGESETNYEFNAEFSLHVSTLLNDPCASIQIQDLDLIAGKMSLSQYQSMVEQIEMCSLNKHEVTGLLDISDPKILEDEKQFECKGTLFLNFSKTYCYAYGCYEYDMQVSVEVKSFEEKHISNYDRVWKNTDDLFLENKNGACFIRINKIRHSDKIMLEIGDQCVAYRRVVNIEHFTSVWVKQFLKGKNTDD